MDNKKPLRLYNLMFPVWMLVWFPSWLWLGLIPANYLLDRLVLRHTLAGREDRELFCRKHAWKICLAGFAGDFVGAALLFAVYAVSHNPLNYALAYQPFSHPGALAVTLASVVLAAGAIFLLDRAILKKAGLEAVQAGKSAMVLAVITAPYLYFFPSGLLYR